MSDHIRINRVVNFLAINTHLRFHRADLARHMSDGRVTVTMRDLTQLWPRIEARLSMRGLYAVRPIGRLRYGVMASTNPLLGYLSLNTREKDIVTRMRNDNAGRVLHGIAAAGGQTAVLATSQLERIQAYLDAYEGSGAETWRLDMDAAAAMRAIPFGTFQWRANYIDDNDGQE